MSAASEVAKAPACTVYYDGACPLCQREISFYRQRKGAEAVRWVDVAQDDAPKDLGPGLDAETAWDGSTCATSTADYTLGPPGSQRSGPRCRSGVRWADWRRRL